MRRVLISIFFALCLFGTHARADTIQEGKPLPAVSVTDWNGRPVALAARHDQITIIDFWASWCPTCRAALPTLDAISQRHPELIVLAINIDKSPGNAERFLAEHLPRAKMTLLRDPDGATFAHFGAAGMPALYVVDRRGVVRLVESGYAPERLVAIEATINELLQSDLETTARMEEPHTQP